MKRLTFLISSPYNELVNRLVHYLIEAGHFVDVISSKDDAIWLSHYAYDFCIVEAAALKYAKYDYALDIDGHLNGAPMLKVTFVLAQKENQNISIFIKLHNQEKSAVLSTFDVKFESMSLNAFYEAITEGFIDALIILLRTNDPATLLIDAHKDSYSNQELFQLEAQLHGFKAHDLAITNLDGSLFLLKDHMESSVGKSHRKFHSKKLKLDTLGIEIMLIYLLMLLNSRQPAIYRFSLSSENKILIKNIFSSPTDTYDTLKGNLCHASHGIGPKQSPLNHSDTDQFSEIIVRINKSVVVEETKYLLDISYDERTHELQILYPQALYFFDELNIYLESFAEKYHFWKTNNVAFNTILCSEISYYQDQLFLWNATEKPFPDNKTLHQLFEEQASLTPNNIAVVCQEETLTYAELNTQANQLSYLLRAHCNIRPDDLVALFLDRNKYTVIAILAVLKAGGAYVPINPEDPDERTQHILKETQANVLLTNKKYNGKLRKLPISEKTIVLNVDDAFLRNPPEEKNLILDNSTKSGTLAYVIYTSGTTGRPKGVMVEHKSIVNVLYAMYDVYKIKEGQAPNNIKIVAFNSYIFDVSVVEFFVALLRGCELHILSDEERHDVNLVSQYVDNKKINYLYLPPSLLASFPKKEYASLQGIIYAGEPCDKKTGLYWSNKCLLYNYYGPTETTIYATGLQVKHDEVHLIGKPLANITCYVLDTQMNPLPKGAIGELYIGGIGLARGYLNQPLLTKERFISNPFQTENENQKNKNSRLYKTGDLVRLLPDANLVYMGRNDSQVKIRGHRVEVSEIEAALLEHTAIQKVFVTSFKHQGNNQLVAYYTHRYSNNKIKWWPSIAEYYIFDDFLYSVMSSYENRNECYRNAIRRVVKGKIVVDIGSGPDLLLAKMCIKEGAKKVYAVEQLEEACRKAQQAIERDDLGDKICLICGDSREISLPEKADVCVSGIVGSIAGAEGAAVILNDAKERHVKKGGCFIPEKSLTKIAAVMLPNDAENVPWLEELPYQYTKKIFEEIGYPFDLRLCPKGASAEHLVSTVDLFEELDWKATDFIRPSHQHEIRLKITHKAKIYGLLAWQHFFTDKDHAINTLEDQYLWLPIYLPIFPDGMSVASGDLILATIERKLCDNQLNCDYIIRGKLVKETQEILFSYNAVHYKQVYRGNKFYQKFFELYERYEDYLIQDPKIFLSKKLSDYMLPHAFVKMDALPLTATGKIDIKALPAPEFSKARDYTGPRNELESILCEIWSSILEIPKSDLSIYDEFFHLGGDSISVIKINHSLGTLGYSVSIKDILLCKNIANLAHLLGG